MDEFDPALDLGFVHDRQLVCGSKGFLQQNDSTRDLCGEFIPYGEKLYDLIVRYDFITSYVIGRSGVRPGSAGRYIAPFLKAFGATDYSALECCRRSFIPMQDAKRTIRHLADTMPTYVSTSSYEHNMIGLCEALGIPRATVNCTNIMFDVCGMSRHEAKGIRDSASKIAGLRLPTNKYKIGSSTKPQEDDAKMVLALDNILLKELRDNSLFESNRDSKVVGANEKAYFLLELRDKISIGLDGTAFIGGDITDFHALMSVRSHGGLAMSFNGCDLAVREANIAVISKDCTVAAVLAEEFYNEGMEAVFSLVENWDRKKLEEKNSSDPHLLSAMLAANPGDLPEVHIVNEDNVDWIAKRSDTYRRNLLNKKEQ